MIQVSVVIPTRGNSASLSLVLEALRREARTGPTFDAVVVVDADATDHPSLETGSNPPDRAVLVLTADQTGASAARNLGWRSSAAPLILFLDDDIVPRPGLIAEHLLWHERHPEREVGVLGKVRWSPLVRVTPFMRWLEMGIQFDYGSITDIDVGWQRFYTCNVSVKRELLAAVGGFDAVRFPFGYEDLELARRMHEQLGFRLLYNEHAVGEHLKVETIHTWRRNLERIAIAERRFVELYGAEQPYFYRLFKEAAEAPPARGRSARLACCIPPRTPWLGKIVWRSFDLVCRQRLAPEFLGHWEQAALAHPLEMP
jgi:GT2 family glycosyltransferase